MADLVLVCSGFLAFSAPVSVFFDPSAGDTDYRSNLCAKKQYSCIMFLFGKWRAKSLHHFVPWLIIDVLENRKHGVSLYFIHPSLNVFLGRGRGMIDRLRTVCSMGKRSF
jgi:hypothetical protein